MNKIAFNQSQEETKNLKEQFPAGHVLHTFISEHEKILGFLQELEATNQLIQNMKNYDENHQAFKKLLHIAEHLVGAEPHHTREEEVLFPELESRGLYGPPQVMRIEHNEIRPKKKELKELASSVQNLDFNIFKEKLDDVSNFIIATLSEHIYKENNILYPMAAETINDDEIWKQMKERCDKIGYCCFTPEQ